MFARIHLILKPYVKIIERLEDKCPLLCVIVFQILVSLFVIGAVSAIALCGLSVIWVFYCFVGMI